MRNDLAWTVLTSRVRRSQPIKAFLLGCAASVRVEIKDSLLPECVATARDGLIDNLPQPFPGHPSQPFSATSAVPLSAVPTEDLAVAKADPTMSNLHTFRTKPSLSHIPQTIPNISHIP